jgi:Trypsin-co-occurring domain 1
VSKYVEFPLEGGGSILIEAADEPNHASAGFLRDGDARPSAEKAQQSFDASIEAVRRSADLLVTKLRGLSAPPDELQITFSLQASGEMGGLTVGKTGAGPNSAANFNVLLKWQKNKEQDEDKEKDKDKEG